MDDTNLTNGLDISKVKVNTKVKKLMALTIVIKSFIDKLENEDENLAMDLKTNNLSISSFLSILKIALNDFDEHTDEFGELGKSFFRTLSKLTDIKQELLEDLEAEELQLIVIKVLEALKDVKFINFFINKISTLQKQTQESNSTEQEKERMITDTTQSNQIG